MLSKLSFIKQQSATWWTFVSKLVNWRRKIRWVQWGKRRRGKLSRCWEKWCRLFGLVETCLLQGRHTLRRGLRRGIWSCIRSPGSWFERSIRLTLLERRRTLSAMGSRDIRGCRRRWNQLSCLYPCCPDLHNFSVLNFYNSIHAHAQFILKKIWFASRGQ